MEKLKPLLFALFFFFPTLQLSAATINVTTTQDEFDQAPEVGTGCSLREAIEAANRNVSFGGCAAGDSTAKDIINLPAATYTLTRVGGQPDTSNDNSVGNLDIDESVLLVGTAPATSTIIEFPNEPLETRGGILRIVGLGRDVRLSNLTLRQGNAVVGGGVYLNASLISIGNSIIRENNATYGGGIAIQGGGTAVIGNSILTQNAAECGGGAIFNDDQGIVSTTDQSEISGNRVTDLSPGACGYDDGGGILNFGSLTITNTELLNNSSPRHGGSIHNTSSGTLQVSRSRLNNNRAGGDGGALNNDGTAAFSDSTLDSNQAVGQGGALLSRGVLTIEGSTLSNNQAGQVGGGLSQAGASRSNIINSTIALNRSGNLGGGDFC